MNAVIADVGGVEAAVATTSGQIGGVVESWDRQTTYGRRQTLGRRRRVVDGDVCRRATDVKDVEMTIKQCQTSYTAVTRQTATSRSADIRQPNCT